jgi:hypothetical protein
MNTNWLYFTVHGRRPAQVHRRRRRGTYRSSERRAWIRQFPCIACEAHYGVEAAHIGAHPLGKKAPDDCLLPICFRCHRTGPLALHRLGPRGFEAAHGLSLDGLLRKFQALWPK